jgi:hypothetical protein
MGGRGDWGWVSYMGYMGYIDCVEVKELTGAEGGIGQAAMRKPWVASQHRMGSAAYAGLRVRMCGGQISAK